MILATNPGCSPSVTFLISTSRCRKTSGNMFHSTETSKTQMMQDAEAVELALKWFEKNKLFDNDGQLVASTIDVKSKVQAL